MSGPIRIAVVGLGKIARDQHLPAISHSAHFELVAAASPGGVLPGVPVFESVEELLASRLEIDAVAMCQPPQLRFSAAARALRAGKHVLLEKPPGATCLEVQALEQLAAEVGKTLFAAWHSRYAPAVGPARAWLARNEIHGVDIQWKEDVRQWHPGQAWIWQCGGFGVFDPGINALSILRQLITEPMFVRSGTMAIPENCAVPIAVTLQMGTTAGIPIAAEFDWRQRGMPTWDITIEAQGGTLQIKQGGGVLHINGRPSEVQNRGEYFEVYEHFRSLILHGTSDVDTVPLRLVADAFLRCLPRSVEPFHEHAQT